MANIVSRALASLILLFCIGTLQAQPGGGGGLTIRDIYDSKGTTISNDSNLKLRAFALRDSSANPTIMEELYLEERSRFRPYIILEPERKTLHSPNLRLVLMYKSDTMIVDFFGIIPSHPAGHRDRLDSLTFTPGYFHFPRNYRRDLSEAGRNQAIKYKGPVDLSFLFEENLPISYHLRKSERLLSNNQSLSALEEMQKAIAKNKNLKHGGILEAQYKIYKKLKQYDKSINAISKLIKLQIPVKNDDNYRSGLVDNYNERINLFYITKQPRKALKDYSEIIKIYPIRAHVSYYVTERAALKIKHLSDNEGAIKDLKSILDTITVENSAYALENRFLTEEYFLLGLAEYKRNNLQLAFKYWCKYGEFGKSGNRDHFDSIIVKHPGVAELHLARAMDLYYDRKSNTLDAENVVLEKAMLDLQSAEKLGLSDFRINLFRAGILDRQKKYDEALAEINIAIEKNPNDPRVYCRKSSIRQNQNGGKWIPNDPDFNKFNELNKTWIFQRYEF